MPRDNEKIIEVLATLQKQFKDALIPLLEADAPPFMVSRTVEMYQAFSEMINSLDEDNRMLVRGHHLPHPDLVDLEAIARKVVAPVAERLERIEGEIREGNNDAP